MFNTALVERLLIVGALFAVILISISGPSNVLLYISVTWVFSVFVGNVVLLITVEVMLLNHLMML